MANNQESHGVQQLWWLGIRIAGWKDYVLTMGQLTAKYLGAGNFDLEVWIELTFGSNFLYINDYYNPAFANYDRNAIWYFSLSRTGLSLDR